MHFTSAFLQSIVLLGAVQGFIISILLFRSKLNRLPNRLLGTLIFLFALACLNLYLNNLEWFASTIPWLVFSAVFPMVVVMPLGPLIFFYTRSLLDPGFKVTKKHRVYFYPVILDLLQHVAALVYIIFGIIGMVSFQDQKIGGYIDDYNTYVDIPRWLSAGIYVLLSLRYLWAFQKQNTPAANGLEKQLKWAREFCYVFAAFQLLWLVHLVPYVIPRYSNTLLDWADWYPLYIPLVILIYWLGIKGYMLSQRQDADKKKTISSFAMLPDSIKYQAIDSIKKAMETDKLFLDQNLNLGLLASHTGIAPKIISTVLNQYIHKSFNEFINEYRVEAFKEKIQQPGMDQLTIAGVAFDCGFNSQATFQRTFKQVTGMSPSEFRKNALQEH